MGKNQKIIVAQIMGKWVGGGVEAVVMNYYRNIDRSKIQFDFICDEDSTNIPYDEIDSLGGKVIICPKYQKVFKYQKELKRIFRENNYPIVHSHINVLSIFPLRAAKKAEVPIRIAHSHSTSNRKEWKKNLLKSILKPFSKVYANRYMCCSEYAGRWLFGSKEYDKGNVYLLNNAIDLDKYRYNEIIRKSKREELGIEKNTFVVGHIGRFVEQKNHRFLIDLFNEIHKDNKNSILLLVGQGPLMQEMMEKVNDLNLNNSVMFLGQRTDVNELYQAFDIFLLPSLYEGLGMVMIEAQCSGLPCIASTEVPKVSKIRENVDFIKLTDSIEKWSSEINQYMITDRDANTIEIENAGYNIKKKNLL